MSQILENPAKKEFNAVTPVSIDYLERPKTYRTGEYIQVMEEWRNKVLEEMQTEIIEIRKLIRKNGCVDADRIKKLIILYRRYNRELAWNYTVKQQNKMWNFAAKQILEEFGKLSMANKSPKAFEKALAGFEKRIEKHAGEMLHGKCSRCGRELWNEKSVRLGIGPVCRRKHSNG